MEELISILESIKPGVDYKMEKHLIDNEIIDSFDVVTIVSQINDEFDIEFPVNEIVPDNFNSVEALYAVITKLQNE